MIKNAEVKKAGLSYVILPKVKHIFIGHEQMNRKIVPHSHIYKESKHK
jgi:hypothetical protein